MLNDYSKLRIKINENRPIMLCVSCQIVMLTKVSLTMALREAGIVFLF